VISAPAPSARVPAPLTPLIGRDGRVDAAWQALQGTRLLTLTGPGGSGKTRLAIELASRADAAAWVELAALADPRLIAEHVAAMLGLSDRSAKPSLPHIVERYSSSAMLLVLDNCEHIVDAAATFVAQVLRDCPAMTVLTTSREALGVCGERTLAVPPLSLPQNNSLEAASQADAIALFVERAQDVRAGFELTTRNATAVVRICQRLDGIPLAIELAAARVRALDPEQLADRLDSSIGLLETGSRAALPRHRTIRETLDWSHRLLAPEERTLLRRLSVFMGTFSLDAIESVCADPGDPPGMVVDRVTGLVDKSLLVYDPSDAGTRYRLLETVREYAAEQLAAAGETDATRDRHARFVVALAERAAPAIFGGVGDEAWMARLDEESANVREALDWCEQDSRRLELSLRLAVALHWYWFARGRFNEGRLRVGIALTFAERIDPVLRGRALSVLGRLALWQGDHANVHAPMEQAVELLRPHGDRTSVAYALQGLAIASALQERFDDARRLLDEAAGAIDTEQAGALMAWVEYWRGLVAEWDDDIDGAFDAYHRAIAAGRRLAHRTIAGHSLCALGRLSAAVGRLAEAENSLREGLAICRDIGDRWGIAFALQGLARAAAMAGKAERAASLLGAADVIREELGIDLHPRAKEYQEATTAEARTRMGEPGFWREWADGKHRALADVIADVMAREAASGDVGPGGPAEEPPVDLRIRALGAFEVHVRNRRVEKSEWGSSRARELLAFLACHPDGCTKAQIGLALWPDASPGQLRNTFHVTLHRLRNALALPDAIQVDGDRYRLNPSQAREFDAELFEQEVQAATRELRRPSTSAGRAESIEGRGAAAMAALETAVGRYRGDFVAGETVGEWADERRARLRERYLHALDALGRARMERGNHLEAADAFGLLLAHDSVNEEACRQQMLCLTRVGDRAGALRAYDALVHALREELGVRPERETTSLRDKLVSTTS
jgi:predicted ATPase/DNA-binding SARP family transcriptional activator